jgi:hypothetical protein
MYAWLKRSGMDYYNGLCQKSAQGTEEIHEKYCDMTPESRNSGEREDVHC